MYSHRDGSHQSTELLFFHLYVRSLLQHRSSVNSLVLGIFLKFICARVPIGACSSNMLNNV